MFLAHRLHTNMLARKRGVFLERPLRRRLDDSSFIIYTTSSYSVARRSVVSLAICNWRVGTRLFNRANITSGDYAYSTTKS